jgi:hypothetical protein
LKIDRTIRTDHQPVYTLEKWLTKEQRDPMSVIRGHVKGDDAAEFIYQQELAKKGAGAVSLETAERGYLTEVGNPYAEMSRDNLFMLMERMNVIVGDGRAVTEAGRYFWTRGMRDELSLEIYTDLENFPTGEQLLGYVNDLSDEERTFKFKDLQKLLTLEGEPVGSDLSKTIHTKWWRFKEMIRDRDGGSFLTYDKFDHATLSLLRLCRTKIASGETRSLEEQWLGFKSPDGRPNEKAINLGDLDWEKVKIPDEVKAQIELSGVGVTDNADNYYWIMGFLSAEDGTPSSQDKRPYQFWMKGADWRKMSGIASYLGKIKFWTITRHDAVAINGEWRKWYAANTGVGLGVRPEDRIRFADFMAGKKATEDVSKGKKDWYAGERSGIEYPQAMLGDIKYRKTNGSEGKMSTMELIEGNQGLAVKYGFISPEKAKKAPEYRLKTLFD